ncbi:ABC transporter ATP-binding protein [Gloeobacter violaceus]|uniref:Oligopeptide ABC transporter ATP-binding protein n=1 Tax=Gloeobacter violaceus (strain ATCC 29082 / PCC 7421) TaxID=251221 RepID=Q7NDV9_GLOVI|nr:ABC transporter ATP-binding protein [Gloeobacter violaceus]BAC92064.1 oligopeptide ABC transporter ATP-binding protein [Gloeobacter violaceus PCC 7421]
MAGPLLSVRNLQTSFFTREGEVRSVDDVSFDLEAGQTLGIVGESGSGKSVTSLSIMRLIPTPPGRIKGGQVFFDGQDLLRLSDREMRAIRGKRIAMIFQDPMSSLNPFLRIARQLTEISELHLGLDRRAARRRAIEMLELVGIPDAARRIDDYPHQFSGGMRQRVMIAMALSCDPQLLIADEPTTALDVTIQAQILELIKDLRNRLGTAVILITHDLGVVAGMADRVAVMYAGKIVESAPTDSLFARPAHPYTQGLLRSMPDPLQEVAELYQIPGLPPDMTCLPPGCAFAPRCPHAAELCAQPPETVAVGATHRSACWLNVRSETRA